MAVNIVLTAILRANVSQFLSGLMQAGKGLQGMQVLAQGLSKAFDVFMLKLFIDLVMQLKDALAGIISDLLETAGKWQQMTIGMSAVILATNKITDATGKQLSYADQFNRSLLISKDLMQKMRIDAALNVGTTQELAAVFTGLANAVSTTAKAGENGIEKTRKLANALVATSYVLGPMVLKGGVDQAVRETNELLEGRLTKINTLARALGLTTGAGKKAYQEAYKAGTVYDFIMGKLKAYSTAQDALSKSYEGLTSTLKDMFDVVKQQTAEFGFNRVNAALLEFTNLIVERLPDGTAKISSAFTEFTSKLGPLFDELMIPLLDLARTLIGIVLDNKDAIISFVRLLINLLAVMIELLNLILTVLRPILDVVISILQFVTDGLNVLIALVRNLVRSIQEAVQWIVNALQPALEGLKKFLNEELQPAVQWFMSKLGQSTDLQEENRKKQEEAAETANTHAEAIGNTNKELDESNKKVKDNTQHWKNWISTLKAAYSNRFTAAAKSFLTMFGSGGTLSPTAGGAGAVPVNINLNGPNGTVSIPAQMTPQQLAQAHRNGRQFSGSLNRMSRGVTMNPAMRNGPLFQN